MFDETTWITNQIEAAKTSHPVSDAVSARLVELLKGSLSERQLTPAEASKIAEQLIIDITPKQSAIEDKP